MRAAYKLRAYGQYDEKDYEGALATIEEAQGTYGYARDVVWAQLMKAQILLDQGKIVKLERRLFAHAGRLEELRRQVAAHFDLEDSLELRHLKEWTGASRKFVVPLAEWLDRSEITRNDGGIRRRGPRS